MNVSNAAYNKPLTTITPSIQREGFDPDRTIEDAWYAPEEKVTPRKYHKYAQASLIERLYGGTEEEESDDGEGGDDNGDGELKDNDQPSQPQEPEQPAEPEEPQPEQPTEP